MVLVYAMTLWLMFGAFLFFPHMGLPRFMSRAAILLAYAEGFTLIVMDYAPRGSYGEGVAEAIAGQDIPALALLLLVLAGAVGVRRQRAARPSPHVAVEDREHVLSGHRAEADDPPALPLRPQGGG